VHPSLIGFQPIRLQATRLAQNVVTLARNGETLGKVWKDEAGGWRYSKDIDDPKPWSAYRRPSFRTAALALARQEYLYLDSDGPHNFGKVHMLRMGGQSDWYTVIFHREETLILEDFSLRRKLSPVKQAMVRKVLAEAERWKQENL
jgi:hypothetical protein